MKPCLPLSRARPLWLHNARRELFLFGLFALLLLGLGIGLRDPWPSDEPRFALVAHWMVEHGQWLFPHRGHELYPDKPPVFMWLQALAYLLTGSWRVAFLLGTLVLPFGLILRRSLPETLHRPEAPSHIHPDQLRHTLATQAKMSGAASNASFGRIGERALAAAQRGEGESGATGTLAPCVTCDATIRLHQDGR